MGSPTAPEDPSETASTYLLQLLANHSYFFDGVCLFERVFHPCTCSCHLLTYMAAKPKRSKLLHVASSSVAYVLFMSLNYNYNSCRLVGRGATSCLLKQRGGGLRDNDNARCVRKYAAIRAQRSTKNQSRKRGLERRRATTATGRDAT